MVEKAGNPCSSPLIQIFELYSYIFLFVKNEVL